jgi:4-amino-4-deoxy-L-arabinose transferase-like glycosyltransferase
VLACQLWLAFHRALNVDEFEHAHATWAMSKGLVPYRDFFEHHTPWLYFAFAPVVGRFAAETDTHAAIALWLTLRVAMWLLLAASVTLVGELGRLWRDGTTGLLAAFLFASSIQVLDTLVEFRPDVPALVCWLIALVCAIRGWRAARAGPAAMHFAASGLGYSGALLFTQKYMFALPGVALMLAGYVADRRPSLVGRGTRIAMVVLFAAAVAAPFAATAWWFASHDALAPFVYYNVEFNVGQNALRFSPLPLLLSNLVHSPALMVLGAIGLSAGWARVRPGTIDDPLVLFATAASLVAGLFVFGRVYGQYVVMFFPHLAVLGAASAPSVVRWIAASLTRRRGLFVALWLVPVAAFGALLVGLDAPSSATGSTMLIAFTVAAALAARALWLRAEGNGARAAVVTIAALTAMTVGNAARIFRPIAPQLEALAYVTEHTRRDDVVLGSGVTGGAGAFRPNAWFFFFMPALAPDAAVEDLVARVTSGELRPRIVAFDDKEGGPPAGLREYLEAHYRRVHGSIYERLPDR